MIDPVVNGAGNDGVVPGAPVIVSNVEGSFPWGVLHRRHPALIGQVRDAFPYPPEVQGGLDRLLEEIEGVIEPLGPGAHDRRAWEVWGRGCFGRRWYDVPFLWSESFFYRKLLEAVGYFEPGPWCGIDPFGPLKRAELGEASLGAELEALDDLSSRSPEERDAALLQASLWGNRADLGFRISAGNVQRAPAAELVADDSGLMWALLGRAAPGTVCMIADNAGRELVADLVLVDHLLETQRAARVVLHVKPYPYYVSDATGADVIEGLRRLAGGSSEPKVNRTETWPSPRGETAAVGRRLWEAMEAGRFLVRTHLFWCAPLSYHHLPAGLAGELAEASVTVLKGDLNYRRLVGDCSWPPTTPFAALTAPWPGPLAVLRTLKSDVVTGIAVETLSALDATGERWRTDGTHALIQARA